MKCLDSRCVKKPEYKCFANISWIKGANIGSPPPPLPQATARVPPWKVKEGQHSLAAANSDEERKPGNLYTLCPHAPPLPAPPLPNNQKCRGTRRFIGDECYSRWRRHWIIIIGLSCIWNWIIWAFETDLLLRTFITVFGFDWAL